MALENTYRINLDLKHGMTSTTPTFRMNDNAILIFDLFDNGVEFPINDSTSAEIIHTSPSGIVVSRDAEFIYVNGKKVITFKYANYELFEDGIYKVTLVVKNNDEQISFQPYATVIYHEGESSSTLIDLIKSLNIYINDAMLKLRDAVMIWEKGVPNGVASLDANGRIPFNQMPLEIANFERHIRTLIYDESVHGTRITKPNDDPNVDAGIYQYYIPPDNRWQNVGFSPDCTGSGGGATELLDVSLDKNNGIITVTYIGVPTVVEQKWDYGERDTNYFANNGTLFTGNSFTVDRIGTYTLYYKDSNGTEYVRVFTMTQSDFVTPTIDVMVERGDVTVTISEPTSIKKWAKGQRDIPYFQSQGNTFTGSTFTVDEIGWYTIYYKTTNGAEYIYQFEVDYSILNGELPIVTYVDVQNPDFDDKYRAFQIGIKDDRVTMVKYTGRYTPIGSTDFEYVYDRDGYYYTNGASGFVDVTSNNSDMTVEFMDNSQNVYATAIHKCRPNYNYFVVNNQYISLTRIKNSTTNYTIPDTIEGLPVLDAGCAFFTNIGGYDNWNVVNLTLPSSIISGGLFAYNTLNSSNSNISTIRIESKIFKFNIPDSFTAFRLNSPSGVTVYVHSNSQTYDEVIDKVSSAVQVNTF